MINIPPTKPTASFKPELLPEITKTWKVGQIVRATAESGGKALSNVLLRIGQYHFEARTPVALKTGEQIQLLVKSLGSTPVLNIQTPITQPGVTQATPVINKLRLFIAQQQSVSKFVELAQKIIIENKVPEDIKTLLNRFISSPPNQEQLLQPAKLKQIIQNSGVFLESKLLSKDTININQDVKAQLLKINQLLQTYQPSQANPAASTETTEIISKFIRGDISIKQLAQQLSSVLTKDQITTLGNYLGNLQKPTFTIAKTDSLYNLNQLFTFIQKHPQAKQLVESMLDAIKNHIAINELRQITDNVLSSITSQQLTPLTKEADNLILLLFGILIKDKEQINLIDFKIEQQGDQEKDNDSENWSVTLNFQFKTLGIFQAKIHLFNSQISTVFTAENHKTVELINNNLNTLNDAFKKLGFNNTHFDVTQNTINTAPTKPENIQIVDDNA